MYQTLLLWFCENLTAILSLCMCRMVTHSWCWDGQNICNFAHKILFYGKNDASIRIVPSDWDTDTHATEPANSDTTTKSSDPMHHNSLTVVKKSNFDQLFCFNAGCLLTICAIGMARTFVIWLINLKITIMLDHDHIRVSPSESDKKAHCVLCTTDRSMIRNNRDSEVPKPHVVENSFTAGNYAGCYFEPSYAVSVGNTVRTYNTKLYASLPQQNKYMVKQRVQDPSRATKIKLVLQSSNERLLI